MSSLTNWGVWDDTFWISCGIGGFVANSRALNDDFNSILPYDFNAGTCVDFGCCKLDNIVWGCTYVPETSWVIWIAAADFGFIGNGGGMLVDSARGTEIIEF